MLDIDLRLMMFVLIMFLVLLVVLNRMLYNPLVKFMDDRDNSIAKDLEAARALANSSQTLHDEAEAILNEAKAEASAIRQKATDEAKVIAQKKAETRQSELEREFVSFLEKLQGEKELLRNSLLSQMPLFKESLKAKFSKL